MGHRKLAIGLSSQAQEGPRTVDDFDDLPVGQGRERLATAARFGREPVRQEAAIRGRPSAAMIGP